MLGGVDVQQVVGLVEGQPFVPKATSRVVGFFPHEHINWPYSYRVLKTEACDHQIIWVNFHCSK